MRVRIVGSDYPGAGPAETTTSDVAKVMLRLFALVCLAIILCVFLYPYVADFSVDVGAEQRTKYAAAAGYAVQRNWAALEAVNKPIRVKRQVWTGDVWVEGVLQWRRSNDAVPLELECGGFPLGAGGNGLLRFLPDRAAGCYGSVSDGASSAVVSEVGDNSRP